MDWEDHLVAPQEALRLAAAFIPLANEAFLSSFANKGLYKRAVKDNEAVQARAFSAQEDALCVSLDGVTVTLYPDLGRCRCACPSKTVCKHVLMGVLCAARLAAGAPHDAAARPLDTPPEPEGAAESQAPPFAALADADPQALCRAAGKRGAAQALRLVRAGCTARFEEGELLTAQLSAEPVTVYFPRVDSVAHAVCGCGAREVCRHKLAAALLYIRQSHPQALDALLRESEALTAAQLDLLGALDGFVLGLLEKGLICAGENDAERAAGLSVRLQAGGMVNLARACRGLSTDLMNLGGKSAAFSPTAAFAVLARLHNTASILLRHPQDGELAARLIEGGRSAYAAVAAGSFMGLGAYPWRTRSGYCGVTVLLCHAESGRVCTYAASLPDFYDKTAAAASMPQIEAQYKRQEHWAARASLEALARGRFALGNFGLSTQNRISSAKQTLCEFVGRTVRADVEALGIVREAGDIPAPEGYSYFARRRAEEVCVLAVSALPHMRYNRAVQTLYITMRDAQGGEAQGEIPFSELHEPAIRRLERLYSRPDAFEPCLMVCLRRGATLQPVSFIAGQGVDSFYLE